MYLNRTEFRDGDGGVAFCGGALHTYVANDPVNFTDPTGTNEIPGATVTGQRPRGGSTPARIGTGGASYYDIAPLEPGDGGAGVVNCNALGCAPEQVVTVIAQRPRPGHYFRRQDRLCTAGPGRPCHIERINTEACVIPGHISTEPIQSGSLYAVYASYSDIWPMGVVRTTQTGGRSFRNTTTWAHPFRGTIDRIFFQDAAGNVDVVTIGQGTAFASLVDRLNETRGAEIFEQQNQVCSAIVGGR